MNRLSFIVVVCFLSFLPVGLQAVPLYYTFSGNVTSLEDPDSLLANAGFSLGSAVTYIFVVDFAQDGYETYFSGESYTYTDRSFNGSLNSYATNYFFTDFYSGTMLDYQYTGSENPDFVAEYNVGTDAWSRGTDYYGSYYTGAGTLQGRSEGDPVSIWKSKSGGRWEQADYQQVQVSDWTIGTQVSGEHEIFGSYGKMEFDLMVTQISEILPGTEVPEPATLVLLGTGLVSCAVAARRKKNILKLNRTVRDL